MRFRIDDNFFMLSVYRYKLHDIQNLIITRYVTKTRILLVVLHDN